MITLGEDSSLVGASFSYFFLDFLVLSIMKCSKPILTRDAAKISLSVLSALGSLKYSLKNSSSVISLVFIELLEAYSKIILHDDMTKLYELNLKAISLWSSTCDFVDDVALGFSASVSFSAI
uniref:Uncharacterized protein n=1 Tax=Coleopteran phenui-related virus OKIAV264 TaxID=2746245 RepID=A0A7D7F189_9VIRU|nr:hypothetical protein [Coleopteran phenui-related virus OKIAV264]